MKKEHIMDAMDYIDPALVAAADAPAPGRGGKRWVRAALIAACLCLTLVGTAVAAVEIIGVRINLQPNPVLAALAPDGYTAYDVEGGIAYLPADSFSQEVWDLAEQGCDKNFADWDEMEQFLGWDLMDNPLLDGYQPKAASPGHPGHIVLTADANQSGLCYIRVSDVQSLDNVTVYRFAQIYTDNAQEGDLAFHRIESVFGYREGSQVTEMEYTTPSGLHAVIIEAVPEGSETPEAAAYFSVNGIRYGIQTDIFAAHYFAPQSAPEPAMVLEVLKTVLDGFVLD